MNLDNFLFFFFCTFSSWLRTYSLRLNIVFQTLLYILQKPPCNISKKSTGEIEHAQRKKFFPKSRVARQITAATRAVKVTFFHIHSFCVHLSRFTHLFFRNQREKNYIFEFDNRRSPPELFDAAAGIQVVVRVSRENFWNPTVLWSWRTRVDYPKLSSRVRRVSESWAMMMF